MSRKNYTDAEKLAAVHLARVSSPPVAAKLLGISESTVRDWLAVIAIPSDQWAALEALFLAKATEMGAKGTTSGLVATLTAAGVSARNRRYGQLIARRDQRREAEAAEAKPQPKLTAALDPDRLRWLRAYLALAAVLHGYRPLSLEADDAAAAAAIRWIGTAPEADLTAQVEHLRAALRDAVAGYSVEKVGGQYLVRNPDGLVVYRGDSVPVEVSHLPVLVTSAPAAAVDVTPKPQRETPEAVQSMVVDLAHDSPTWRRLE